VYTPLSSSRRTDRQISNQSLLKYPGEDYLGVPQFSTALFTVSVFNRPLYFKGQADLDLLELGKAFWRKGA
jgi:hypothetical protein